MREEPSNAEILARRMAARLGADPDHMVLPPWLTPARVPIIGGHAISAQGSFAPVPLWRCYLRLAEDMLDAGDVFL